MAQVNLMFPILPGQKEAHQALLAQVLGEKRADFDARCHRLGVNWERGFYLDGPAGTLFLLAVDADDPATLLPRLIEAPSAFEQWFMQQASAIHGLTPEAAQHMAPPEAIFDWRAGSQAAHGKPTTMFAVPVLDVPGWKGMIEVLKTEKLAGFAAERESVGITRETHFLHQTPMGAFTAIALEGTISADFAAHMAKPVNAFGEWFVAQIAKFNGFTPEAAAHLVLPTPAYDFEATPAAAATR